MTLKQHRNRLWEAYRTSFKNYTLATSRLRSLPSSDPIDLEMAWAEIEEARAAYSRSRDALVPELLGQSTAQATEPAQCESAVCCG